MSNSLIEFLKFVYPYILKHKRTFFLSSVFILLGAITQIEIALYIQQIIGLIPNKQIVSAISKSKLQSEIFSGFLILLGISFIDYIAQLGMRWFSVSYARNVIESIRNDVFIKLHKQEMQYYSTESVGQLLARTMDDVFYLQDVMSWAWRVVGSITAISVGIIIVMYLTSPVLAIIFGLTFPLLLFVLGRITSKNAKIFYDARYRFGELSDTMAENLSGIMTVKAFGREKEQIKLFKSKNDAYIDKATEQVIVRSYLRPGMIALYSFAVVTFLFAGGLFLQSGVIEASVFISFMYLILKLSQQMRFLGFLGIDVMIADSSAKRLNEILKKPLVMVDDLNAKDIENMNGLIEFKNVSFTYPGNDYLSLKNINLTIKPGEKVAILGPTGAGKTTLINLIPRFYDPTEGKVLIDGKDIKHVTRNSIRDRIQIVHQDNFLYTISIFDNISYGKNDSTLDEVIHYAEASQIHTFVNSLENKYDTIVGERGVSLSGGQRQRTTIARGLIIKPKIVIFDDSVSAVDPETESRIQNTIAEMDKDITLIIISQRPSSLKYVDRIIVLDEGEIVQEGHHDELIQEEGIYKRFVNSVKRQVKFINWDENKSEKVPTGVYIQPGD